MEDNKNEMSITEAIERCDIMLNAISINGAEKGFANDDNGFPDCVVMKSIIRRCKWALKKQIPMKPRNERRSVPLSRTSVRFVDWYKCGKCNSDLNRQFVCCPYCQSVIDWGDENDD